MEHVHAKLDSEIMVQFWNANPALIDAAPVTLKESVLYAQQQGKKIQIKLLFLK